MKRILFFLVFCCANLFAQNCPSDSNFQEDYPYINSFGFDNGWLNIKEVSLYSVVLEVPVYYNELGLSGDQEWIDDPTSYNPSDGYYINTMLRDDYVDGVSVKVNCEGFGQIEVVNFDYSYSHSNTVEKEFDVNLMNETHAVSDYQTNGRVREVTYHSPEGFLNYPDSKWTIAEVVWWIPPALVNKELVFTIEGNFIDNNSGLNNSDTNDDGSIQIANEAYNASNIRCITVNEIPATYDNFQATQDECEKIIFNWDLGSESVFTRKFTLKKVNEEDTLFSVAGNNTINSTGTFTKMYEETSDVISNEFELVQEYRMDWDNSGLYYSMNHDNITNFVVGKAKSKPAPVENLMSFYGFNSESNEQNAYLRWDNTNHNASIENIHIKRNGVSIDNPTIGDLTYATTVFNPNEPGGEVVYIDAWDKWTETNVLESCELYTYEVTTSNSCYQNELSLASQVQFVPYFKVNYINEDGEAVDYNSGVSIFPSKTFDNKTFNVSKGYYTERVFLEWEANYIDYVQDFTVQRRLFAEGIGADENWGSIGNTDVLSFEDIYAEPYTLYEYRILANYTCNDHGDLDGIISQSEIGFRSPEAEIHGSVSFESGTAVENVSVSAVPQEGFESNYALHFDGDDRVNFSSAFTGDNANNSDFSIGMWVNSTSSLSQVERILGVTNGSNDRALMHLRTTNESNKSLYFWYRNTDNDMSYFTVSSNQEILSQWNYVIISYSKDESELSVYFNGELISTRQDVEAFDPSTANYNIGAKPNGENPFTGYIDEVSVWNKYLTAEEVEDVSGRYLSKTEDGMVAYYTCDEGYGEYLYDISKDQVGNPNMNHINYQGLIYINDNLPIDEQLSFNTLTNEYGNYSIKGIRYPAVGSVFTVTPFTLEENGFVTPHEFSPNNTNKMISDQANYHTDVNFTDVSAFDVSGKILFNVHDEMLKDGVNNYSIPVEGVNVLIDNKIQNNSDNEEIVTDSQGNFMVSVPIGVHTISFEKDGHEFEYKVKVGSEALYKDFSDETDPFDFQHAINLNDFTDIVCTSTKSLVVRVTGGLKHQDIDLGWASLVPNGEQVNTIGQVTFDIIPEGDVNNASGHRINITTDVLTGEDEVELLPIKYEIVKASFNSSNQNVVEEYGVDSEYVFDILDFNVRGSLNEEGDFIEEIITSVKPGAQLVAEEYSDEDVKTFHHSYQINYRVSPSIEVKQKIESINSSSDEGYGDFIGVDEVNTIDNTIISLIDIEGNALLSNPVFCTLEDQYFSFKIDVVEVYENFGTISNILQNEDVEEFLISVDEGVITINNTMLTEPLTQYNIADNEQTYYNFNPNDPHVFGIEEDFLRSIVINYQNGTIIDNFTEEVYLLGAKSFGNDFFTFGPQVVDIILRDPNGDASSTWLEQGTTLSRSTSISSVNGISQEFSIDFSLGTNWGFETYGGLWAGLGGGIVGVKDIASLEASAGAQTNATNTAYIFESDEGGFVQEEVFSTSISTSGDEFNIGHLGDVFVGESKNMIFGTQKSLTLIDSEDCDVGGGIFECSDISISSGSQVFYLGTKTVASVSPGTNTTFAYTTNYIQNYLIPKLIFIRNSYILGEYEYDNTLVSIDHDCFGEPWDSECFDGELSGPYYTIPENLEDEEFQVPVLSNYTESIKKKIFASSIDDYNNLFNGINGTYDHIYNNDNLSWSDATEIIGGESIGAFFNSDAYDDQDDINTFISKFCDNVNIENTPGLIGLNDVLNIEQSSESFISIPRDKAAYYNQQLMQWEKALALNELDKAQQNNTVLNNFSISPGVEIESSFNSVASYANNTTIGYSISESDGVGVYGSFDGEIFGFAVESEGEYMHTWTHEFDFETTTELYAENENVIGFNLSDDDQGDVISINVEESNLGFSPIFKTIAGATSCPWEDYSSTSLLHNLNYNSFKKFTYSYYKAHNPSLSQSDLDDVIQESYNSLMPETFDPIVLSETTSQREKPTIGVSPYTQFNVPEQVQAVFTITLGNESETGDDMVYTLRVDEASNPYGAVIKIDGQSVLRDIMVPGGGIVTKTVTVEKGPIELSYDSLGLILHSACQYEFATADEMDIADSIYFSVHYLPTCTDIDFSGLDDNWIINTTNENEEGDNVMEISLRDYNANYYSLENLAFQYRNMNGGDWVQPVKFDNLNFIAQEYFLSNLAAPDLYTLLFELNVENENLDVNYWYSTLEPSNKCYTSEQSCNVYAEYDTDENDEIEPENKSIHWLRWKYCDLELSDSPTESEPDLVDSQKKNYIEAVQEFLIGEIGSLEFIAHDNLKTEYEWALPPVDGQYEIRSKSYCGKYTSMSGDLENVEEYSSAYSGIVDRIRPENFGVPQPADGILEPNDEVLLTFNEAINEYAFNSSFAASDVEVKAVKNNSEIRHDAFLSFDGTQSMNIPTGVNIAQKSFTFETWVNISEMPSSSATLFKQGVTTDGQQLKLELLDDRKLKLSNTKFDSEGAEITDQSFSVISSSSIPLDVWKHIAITYDVENGDVSFVINGTVATGDTKQLSGEYEAEGAISVGDGLMGTIHEMRIWQVAKFSSIIYANMLNTLSGREANLLGYWPMNELAGNPRDKSRSRHAVTTAQWAVSDAGNAYSFDQSIDNIDYLIDHNFGGVVFEQSHDFTIEFWAKGIEGTIFSNGSYIGSVPKEIDGSFVSNYGNLYAWSIGFKDQRLQVHHGYSEENVSSLLMESIETINVNAWNHIALVKRAKTNTTLFVNGVEVASINSNHTNAFGGGKLCLGAKLLNNISAYNVYEAFDGVIDEVRVWSKAKTIEQIQSEAHSQLYGNEIGLETYYNFDDFLGATDMFMTNDYGLIAENSQEYNDYYDVEENNEEAEDLDNEEDLVYENYESLSGLSNWNHEVETADIPLIAQNPIKSSVAFHKISNGDQVLIELTEELANIENCIVDVTIDKVYDLNGNQMEEPLTWSFYVNKNQLIWDEQLIEKEKLLGAPMVFETHIINQGGQVEQFEISNLPAWLTAIPSEGILEPNSFQQIEFVVNEDLFIGDYNEDLILTGNNEYGERLEFQLEVEAEAPNYAFDPSDYIYMMNFVGKVTVDDIRSRDDKDILYAYVGDELRGMSELIYLEDYDAYYVFLNVYSNQDSGEELSFRLWDASEGKIQSQVHLNDAIEIAFEDGVIVGSFTNEAHFAASNVLRQEIPLHQGWNWISFNLDAEDEADDYHLMIPTVFNQVENSWIQNLKTQNGFSQYYEDVQGGEGDWYGTLEQLDVQKMYMTKISQADTIVYEGEAINPTDVPITINNGWNWIGYLGQRMLSTNEALSSLNPSSGDIIKSQTAFSMYANESLGWLGTLSNMQGGEGYMLKHSGEATLTYPESSMYGGGSFRLDRNQYAAEFWPVNPNKYENSMNVVARVDHIDYQQPNLENLLGAFAKAECFGNISATVIDEEQSLYFLTLYGVEDTRLRFDYYDAEKDKVYTTDNTIDFVPNKTIGTIENPYPITIDVEAQDIEAFFALDVYPNPFVDAFEVVFTLEEETEVEIQLFDVMGRFVKSISKEQLAEGIHQIKIDGEQLTKGIYFIEVQVGENTYKKMIVKS